MLPSPRTIVIVGANVAGARGAEALRQAGFDGRVLLVGEERWPPYERPPLSKDYLLPTSGSSPNLYLHDDDWYTEHEVELILGARAEALDLQAGGVRLANSTTLLADRILLATGGRLRRLSLAGSHASNVHYLRSKDDAEGIAKALHPGAEVVVIGMGVIGAEVAAIARMTGCEVTAVEPEASPMLRTLGARFGTWLGRVHAANGVTCRFRTGVTRLITDVDGDVRAVECDDGSRVSCDAVVVGIGIEPAVELARSAGLALGNGIQVDSQCRTSHPHIFAAGDVAEQPGFDGARVRLETFHNAADQGAAAARAMLDEQVDYRRPCRFWSDQYDLNLQMIGRLDDTLSVVLRGDIEDSSFSAFFLDAGVVAGMLAVNRAADVGPGRRLVEQRLSIAPAQLGDASVPLRKLLRKRSPDTPPERARTTNIPGETSKPKVGGGHE